MQDIIICRMLLYYSRHRMLAKLAFYCFAILLAIFEPFTESVQWKIRIIPNTRPITWQSSTMIGSIVSFSGCRRM